MASSRRVQTAECVHYRDLVESARQVDKGEEVRRPVATRERGKELHEVVEKREKKEERERKRERDKEVERKREEEGTTGR